MGVTTFRLEDWILRQLDFLAKREQVDRTTILRKAVVIGINEIKLGKALEEYKAKRISAWKAAEEAGISLWEFVDELKKRDIPFKTSEEDLEEMLEEL